MSCYTREDILRMLEEEDVEFIRLQFTDLFGTLKNIAVTTSQIDRILDHQIMFDGASIEGFARIEESILNARRYYNAVVREYNDRTMVFPSSIIASAFHFTSRDYVDIADSDKERVKVGF